MMKLWRINIFLVHQVEVRISGGSLYIQSFVFHIMHGTASPAGVTGRALNDIYIYIRVGILIVATLL